MAIVTINNDDGTMLTRSTIGMMIERDGVRYESAVDPVGTAREYVETDVPIEGFVPMKYSTLSVKRELANIVKEDGQNAWEKTKALMQQTGYWDDYILANYISETDPAFPVICSALVSANIVTQDELNQFLPKCEWSND